MPEYRANARLTELEYYALKALAMARSDSQVIREAIWLLWKERGERTLEALAIVAPADAERLRELLADGFEPPKRGRRFKKDKETR